MALTLGYFVRETMLTESHCHFPLLRSVAGMFKEVITIFLSTVVFHDELTPINISGLCVALVGIALYNYLKYRNYKVIEKRVLENGGSLDELQDSSSRENGGEVEAELEALHSSRTRRDHDGTQFQLVGEDDFDSSDDSDNEDDNKDSRRKPMQSANGGLYDGESNLDGIERLPAYAETHPNEPSETRQMEEKVNHDPMLLDLDREEERLELEMENTRHHSGQNSSTSSSQDLLFDADETNINGGKDRQQVG